MDKLKVIGADGRVAAGFEVYLPSGRFSIRERAKATAVEAIRGGATRAEAVARSGLCGRTISKLRSRLGLAIHRRTFCTDRDDALIAAHEEGLRPAEIARRFGWNVGYVHCLYARLRKRSGLALAFDRGKEQVERPPRQRPPRERLAASRAAGNARDDALIAAHDEGLLPAEIARRFGWSVGYVHCLYWELRKRSGLELAFDRTKQQAERWDGHIERRLAEVEAAFRGGRSAEEIADNVGISVTSVRTYVAKLGRRRGTPFRFDRTKNSRNARLGRERRRLIAEAYEVGMTLDDLASRTGLSARLVQAHLVRLRREAGQPFAITPRPSHAGKPRLLAIGEAAVPTQALPCGRTQERREPNTVAATGLAP